MGVTETQRPAAEAARPAEIEEFDAVIVGGSLAGCAAAIALGRAGARVALVEQRADASAYKQVCSHFIQASAIPTLERLGLLEPLERAGAVRSSIRIWTRWGWIVAPPELARPGINLRRSVLDPLLREQALATPGVEPRLGRTAVGLLRDDAGAAGEPGRVRGVVVRDRAGEERHLRARLTIGADGRGSKVAALSGGSVRRTAHARFAYGAYFEGGAPAHAPDASLWFCDPTWAAAFPTDSGLTFYAAMPTKERLPEFRRDPVGALVALLADLPDPPPIHEARVVDGVKGKLDMEIVEHEPIGPGLALVGDAALATDPLWGIGCGWALQSAEWLGEAVGAALAAGPDADATLDAGLVRYRRRWRRGLLLHARVIEDYAGGRKLNPGERFVFSAAAHDPRLAATMEAYGSRSIGPARALARAVPRATLTHARQAGEAVRRRRAAREAVAA